MKVPYIYFKLLKCKIKDGNLLAVKHANQHTKPLSKDGNVYAANRSKNILNLHIIDGVEVLYNSSNIRLEFHRPLNINYIILINPLDLC